MLQLNILTPGCAMWHNGKTRSCGINHGCFCFWDWCLATLVVLVLILVSLAKIFVCLLPLFLTQSGSPHQCQPRNTLQQVCKSVCCKQQQRTHCSSDVWRCFFKAQAHRQSTATAVAAHIADWTHHLVLSVSLQLLPQLNFQVRTFCLLLSPTGHEQHLHSIEKTVAAMTHHHRHRSRLCCHQHPCLSGCQRDWTSNASILVGSQIFLWQKQPRCGSQFSWQETATMSVCVSCGPSIRQADRDEVPRIVLHVAQQKQEKRQAQ